MPKVFGDGDVTVAVSVDGAALWIGQRRIGMFTGLSVEADTQSPSNVRVEIRFQRSHDPEVDKEIEENARAAAVFPWVKVVR